MNTKKFHINLTSEVKPCTAQEGNCPFGGETGKDNHYPTVEIAEQARDTNLRDKYGILPHFPITDKIKERETQTDKEYIESVYQRFLINLEYKEYLKDSDHLMERRLRDEQDDIGYQNSIYQFKERKTVDICYLKEIFKREKVEMHDRLSFKMAYDYLIIENIAHPWNKPNEYFTKRNLKEVFQRYRLSSCAINDKKADREFMFMLKDMFKKYPDFYLKILRNLANEKREKIENERITNEIRNIRKKMVKQKRNAMKKLKAG